MGTEDRETFGRLLLGDQFSFQGDTDIYEFKGKTNKSFITYNQTKKVVVRFEKHEKFLERKVVRA